MTWSLDTITRYRSGCLVFCIDASFFHPFLPFGWCRVRQSVESCQCQWRCHLSLEWWWPDQKNINTFALGLPSGWCMLTMRWSAWWLPCLNMEYCCSYRLVITNSYLCSFRVNGNLSYESKSLLMLFMFRLRYRSCFLTALCICLLDLIFNWATLVSSVFKLLPASVSPAGSSLTENLWEKYYDEMVVVSTKICLYLVLRITKKNFFIYIYQVNNG